MPRCSAHSISALAQEAVGAISNWRGGEVQSRESMRKVQQVVASAWLCFQLWQGPGTVLQDHGRSLCLHGQLLHHRHAEEMAHDLETKQNILCLRNNSKEF